jgi:IS5 family transposase
MTHKNQRGIFEESDRLKKLTKQNDPLVKLNSLIHWEQFRSIITKALDKEAQGPGGRPAYDPILMFKILILQRFYNLSDDQTEFQILDRFSFMRFLDLTVNDRVPDSKTIWLFREQLVNQKLVDKLFEKFLTSLEKNGLLIHEGKIIDASFVEVPKQRNSRDENKQIKEGQTPENWEKNPSKLAQKDVDARWTKKNNVSFYGYKDHVKVDGKSKLIERYTVTPASVHDSQELDTLLERSDKGQELYADSAYKGEEQSLILKKRKVIDQVCAKGYKNKPLNKKQIKSNKKKSKMRARVEHVFGFMENSMNKLFIRTIGKKRAEAVIGLINLTYNLFRATQILKKQGKTVAI